MVFPKEGQLAYYPLSNITVFGKDMGWEVGPKTNYAGRGGAHLALSSYITVSLLSQLFTELFHKFQSYKVCLLFLLLLRLLDVGCAQPPPLPMFLLRRKFF